MVKLTFVLEDDRDKTVIQMKEPAVTGDTMALTYDDFDSFGYLPLDAFKRLLKGAGYHDYSISKYLLDGAISTCCNDLHREEGIAIIKEVLRDYGIYDKVVEEEEEEN